MTQPTETTRYRFDAAILGKEVRGQKTMVKLDWKLPSAKYEINLYLDPDDAQILNVGDRLHWSIIRGGLGKDKNNNIKSGQYPTDYFWDWDKDDSAATSPRNSPTVYQDEAGTLFPPDNLDDAERSMEQDFIPGWDPDPRVEECRCGTEAAAEGHIKGSKGCVHELRAEQSGDPRAQEPQRPHTGIIPVILEVDAPPPNPAAVGACTNHAVTFIDNGTWPLPEGRDLDSWICEKRDSLYWNVNQMVIMPPHFCYTHLVGRNKDSKDRYYHKSGENYCMETGLVDSNGERVE